MKADLSLLSTVDASAPLRRAPERAKPKSEEAAAQFEQIFLRKMLGSLMQSAKIGPQSKLSGGEMYDTMIVDALASSISAGGGIGIAEMIQSRIDAAPGSAQGPPPAAVVETAPSESEHALSGQPANGRDGAQEMPSSISGGDRLSRMEVSTDHQTPRRTR